MAPSIPCRMRLRVIAGSGLEGGEQLGGADCSQGWSESAASETEACEVAHTIGRLISAIEMEGGLAVRDVLSGREIGILRKALQPFGAAIAERPRVGRGEAGEPAGERHRRIPSSYLAVSQQFFPRKGQSAE